MIKNKKFLFFSLLIFLGFIKLSAAPHFVKKGNQNQLYVNNQPFIILSIEDHKIIGKGMIPDDFYFREAKNLHANTVSYTCRWNIFEKEKDVYDTVFLSNVKKEAEKNKLKIIILWFGSNISGHENCAPDYVRADPFTYIPYTRSDCSLAEKTSGGDNGIYCYSYDKLFPNPLLAREEKALRTLLFWIKKNDHKETFIMLQLENELFVNPDLWESWSLSDKYYTDRCHCHRCEDIFMSKKSTTDLEYEQSVFFNYIKELASSAGQVAPGFPLYLNVVVNWGWKNLTGNPYSQRKKYLDSIPALAFIAADIYFEDAVTYLDSLNTGRNILFIPEAGNPKGYLDGLAAFSMPFVIVGKYRGIGMQIYDLKSDDFGLITGSGEWKDVAYRVRNSYAIIQQIPVLYLKNTVASFRNLNKESIKFGKININVSATNESQYARGLIINNKRELIICGIGFQAEISGLNVKKIKIERGWWEQNKFRPLGQPRTGSYNQNNNSFFIILDDDEMSGSGIFKPTYGQYCIRIRY